MTEYGRPDMKRAIFLTTGYSSNRISRQQNARQFIDHQHDEAAVSLNQANHQVQILFVRACINMCLSSWKTVIGKQHDLPVRAAKCLGESRPTCCPNMAAHRIYFSVYCKCTFLLILMSGQKDSERFFFFIFTLTIFLHVCMTGL